MPKMITKYRLHSDVGNENEFEVTRIKIVETRKTITTDDEGYPFSNRHQPKTEKIVKHGLEAKSLPSRRPATIEVLEMKEVSEAEELMLNSVVNKTVFADSIPENIPEEDSGKPSRARPSNFKLTEALNNVEGRPTVIPKSSGPIWADDSQNNNQGNEKESF